MKLTEAELVDVLRRLPTARLEGPPVEQIFIPEPDRGRVSAAPCTELSTHQRVLRFSLETFNSPATFRREARWVLRTEAQQIDDINGHIAVARALITFLINNDGGVARAAANVVLRFLEELPPR